MTPIASPRIGSNVARFLKAVATFKAKATSKTPSTRQLGSPRSIALRYSREFSGIKKGQRKREFEYMTRHGDVVHALLQWREARPKGKPSRSEWIFNDANIDLGVARGGQLAEIYEVKTNCDRQTLYTAIGQLMLLGSITNDQPKRYLVLPGGDCVDPNLGQAIRKLGISIIHYEIDQADRISISK